MGHIYDYMRRRAIELGFYIADTGCTVREAAKVFQISKTTVFNDVSKRLPTIDPMLGNRVRVVLDTNLQERAHRGGESNKRKLRGE